MRHCSIAQEEIHLLLRHRDLRLGGFALCATARPITLRIRHAITYDRFRYAEMPRMTISHLTLTITSISQFISYSP
jgi:hypothetical protein